MNQCSKKCRLFSLVFIGLLTMGCTLPADIISQNEQLKDSPEYVKVTAYELAQFKDAASQWQQSRSGIERLLKLEHKITYLVEHIDIINRKAIASSKRGDNSQIRSLTREKVRKKNLFNSKKLAKSTKVINSKKIFALQVASLDSQESIIEEWKHINKKAALLLKSRITTNVERAKVNNKVYYRLKLGEYFDLKSAKADCEVFKFYKVNCFVSNYTDEPIRL